MSLLEKAINGVFRLKADAGGTPAPWDDFWYHAVGAGSATGMRVSADTVKRVAAVLACVGVIGRAIGAMPLKIFRESSDGSKTVASGHPLYDVLYLTPNDQQTSFEYKQMLQGHLELRGNCYAEILPGPRGAVDQLVPLHPDRIIVQRLATGRLRYEYADPLTNQTRMLMQDEVFHLRNFSDDGLVGQSTVAMSSDTFGVALAAQEYSARFFQNDAVPRGVIQGASFKDKEAQVKFREDWQEQQSKANRHKVAVLAPGMEFKSMGVSSADAQLLDARKFSRIEICSIFGVPPHLIGETEKAATYASVEQFNIMFAVYCIWPRLVMWEQKIQRDLILAPQYFPKFIMTALLRGDTASRYNAYKVGIENGWLSQDDVRIMEDLNPIPDGSGADYWRPLNWARLKDKAPSATPPPSQAPDTTSDPGAGEGEAGNEQAMQRERLKLLAASAAERCARKESAAVSELLGQSDEKIDAFYSKHARFLAEAMNVPLDKAEKYSQQRADCLKAAKATGDDFLDRVMQSWYQIAVQKLSIMAVGGKQ